MNLRQLQTLMFYLQLQGDLLRMITESAMFPEVARPWGRSGSRASKNHGAVHPVSCPRGRCQCLVSPRLFLVTARQAEPLRSFSDRKISVFTQDCFSCWRRIHFGVTPAWKLGTWSPGIGSSVSPQCLPFWAPRRVTALTELLVPTGAWKETDSDQDILQSEL